MLLIKTILQLVFLSSWLSRKFDFRFSHFFKQTDLLLAAEIGKTLLEKNRELEILLKNTQDYADEKAAQAEVSVCSILFQIFF